MISLAKRGKNGYYLLRGAIGETVNTWGCEPHMNGFDSHIAPHT